MMKNRSSSQYGIFYVFIHFWLWPFRFWLRPLAVIQNIRDNNRKWAEVICATLGSGIYGGGLGLYVYSENTDMAWLAAGVAAITFISAVSISTAGTGVAIFVIVFVGTATTAGIVVISAYATAIGVSVAGAILVALAAFFTVVSTGATAISGAITVVVTATILSVLGMFSDSYISIYIKNYFLLIVSLSFFFPYFFFWAVFHNFIEEHRNPHWFTKVFLLLCLIGTIFTFWGKSNVLDEYTPIWAISLFRFFLETVISDEYVPILGISLSVSIATGLLIVFVKKYDASKKYFDFRKVHNKQIKYLVSYWFLFSILSLIAWLFDPTIPYLNGTLENIALFFIITPLLWTGLLLYPVVFLLSIWQLFQLKSKKNSIMSMNQLVPMQWQSFAYHLPGLEKSLVCFLRNYDPLTAFRTLQTIQYQSLQVRASKQAMIQLAKNKQTVLSFCGTVASQSNSSTIAPFSLFSPAARAVAVMAGKPNINEYEPLRLFVANFPPKNKMVLSFLHKGPYQKKSEIISEFQKNRYSDIKSRIKYALNELSLCQEYSQADILIDLLERLKKHIYISDLRYYTDAIDDLNMIEGKMMSIQWMNDGWKLLSKISGSLADLDSYRELTEPLSRRQFLEEKARQLEELKWDEFRPYWGNIAKDVTANWIDVLNKEARQAKEWLKVRISVPDQHIRIGSREFLVELHNDSKILAKVITITPITIKGVDWLVPELKEKMLEGNKKELLSYPLYCDKPGLYDFKGQVKAVDIQGVSYELPFSFKLPIGKDGKAYVPPQSDPYVVGTGLGDDSAFSGREVLLKQLMSLWKQPKGKPAVVLIGQRRIGKTSLLRKILRSNLAEAKLLPVFIDIQNLSSEYDFLNCLANRIKNACPGKQKKIEIAKDEPYVDFKNYLSTFSSRLNGYRFLIMVDEADLMPERGLNKLLPGFLRSLMQGHEYPVLLLFCGTYNLNKMAHDYQSVLFNTAKTIHVSYMSEQEAGDVLSKPTKGVLDFDPIVLKQAYRLTNGQPLLLQTIGSKLYEQFNTDYFERKKRGCYVDLNDLSRSVDAVVQFQSDFAYEEHWDTSGVNIHHILSVLAWATDEESRKQLDINGIEDGFNECKIRFQRNMAFKILQQLTEEEILINEGLTYRFAVPLYRRWVAWRWDPEKVRWEEN